MQRLLKALHQLGGIGLAGSLAACIVLVVTAPTDSLVGYAAVRQGIAAISQWLLVPSLAIVLVSGLLAIAANRAYHDAGWAWIKALLGIVPTRRGAAHRVGQPVAHPRAVDRQRAAGRVAAADPAPGVVIVTPRAPRRRWTAR
jgi:hypothetical protein